MVLLQKKVCSKCAIEYPATLDYFHTHKSKEGLRPDCKYCKRAYNRKRYNENILAEREGARIRNAKKETKERKRLHCLNNEARYKQIRAKWKEDNPQKWKESQKKYRQSPKGKTTLNTFYRKYRELKKGMNSTFSSINDLTVRLVFGNCCFFCGLSDAEHQQTWNTKLNIDHHKPLSRGNPLTVTNAVLLCKSCNSKKWMHKPEDFYSKDQLVEIAKIHSSIGDF